jgi:transcriptional regulatory protein RtcR
MVEAPPHPATLKTYPKKYKAIQMKNIVFSVLGSKKDYSGGRGRKRWYRWRPNLSILMHHEFPVHELILVHHEEEQALADFIIADMSELAPQTQITTYSVDYENPWHFGQVYAQLRDITQLHPFDPEQYNYYTHINTGTHVVRICLFLLAEANYLPGKLLQTSPSPLGPDGTYRIIDLDLSQYDEIASRYAQDAEIGENHLKGGIETRSSAFNQMIKQIEQVCIRSTAPMLLTGPTGAGKSRLAQRIYQLKKQRGQISGRLVEVNCATLRGDNAMSALFGHVKGAFTGAQNARKGLLREADGGLLFLDEIGELGLDEQAMLLRAIEDKVFIPLGADQPLSSDFQLIAGTNRNLQQRVSEGQFREDLLARINLWAYEMPSLKARIEDLDPNIDYELRHFTRLMGHKVSFNQGARRHYLEFAHSAQASWRANFRDLNSSITRMATLATGGRITEAIVAGEIQRLQQDWGGYATDGPQQSVQQLLQTVLTPEQLTDIDRFDQAQLAEVIQVCRNSKTMAEAGRTLFNVSRTRRSSNNDSHRLRTYLQKFGLVFAELTER